MGTAWGHIPNPLVDAHIFRIGGSPREGAGVVQGDGWWICREGHLRWGDKALFPHLYGDRGTRPASQKDHQAIGWTEWNSFFKNSIASNQEVPNRDNAPVKEEKSSPILFLRGVFGNDNKTISRIINGEVVEGKVHMPPPDR